MLYFYQHYLEVTMHPVWYFVIAAGVLIFLTLTVALVCYMRIFHCKKRVIDKTKEVHVPRSKVYDPYREKILSWVDMTRAIGCEEVSITSHDGLTLRGYYYEYKKGASLEILFHGYHGNAERDLSGGVDRCQRLGRNALIVDQRACGASDGSTTTFGILESRDCLRWVDFAISKFGDDVTIILTGVSMGAATVMIAAGEKLPNNVGYVLADCGYTSAREIIKKVMRDMRLPANLLYPFAVLGARLFGGFSLDSRSPIEAVKHATVPIIFIHGDADDFVPCSMSEELYSVCSSKKKLTKIEGAGHGVAFPANEEKYIEALAEFSAELGII